jgi:hypothetical protein
VAHRAGTPYESAVLDDAPIAYYRLGDAVDTGSPTTAHDDSGFGHDGTYAGGAESSTPGAIIADADGYLALDAATNSLSVPHWAGLDFTTFTLEAWIQVTSVPAFNRLFGRTGGSSAPFTVGNNSSGQIVVRIHNGTTSVDYTSVGAATGSWHHVVITRSSGGTLSIYLNGALDAQFTSALAPNAGTTEDLSAGDDGVGFLDELALYDYVLSPSRIATHWVLGHGEEGGAVLTLTASGGVTSVGTGGFGFLELSAGGEAIALYVTDTSNAFDGLDLVGAATVTSVSPAAAPPASLVPAARYAGTRALARLAGRTRIVVGGVDVQYFRDYSTPMPRYTLTEPFAYGATSIQFPQVHMGYEQAGVGDLAWAHEGAAVTISRVFDDGSETVDYRGRVISVEAAGRVLNLDVGGQFSGPANTLEEQTLMYRQSLDVGRYASLAAGRCGLSFSPWFGPATGIELTHSGGQSLLSWAQYLGAMSQDVSGQQRALMPTVWGGNTWGFEVKDYTTRHFTAFNDDARVVVEVSQDASEAPNVIYGTGITPDGERITNAKWPGVFAGPPPDYPMAGNVNFGSGTTDGDTVNGDGITVLYVKLREMGYLPFQIENTGVYTSDIVAAVRKLQRDVGLTVTGTMTLAAWKRLFNVDYTGYSINGARIAPLAADPRVEEFLYTSNGSVAGRNPDYDPTILRVERTIDFGSGITKSAMIAYAQGILARSSSLKNWVGTIRLNGAGVFTGSHDSGTGLTEAPCSTSPALMWTTPGRR